MLEPRRNPRWYKKTNGFTERFALKIQRITDNNNGDAMHDRLETIALDIDSGEMTLDEAHSELGEEGYDKLLAIL